jgi:hypothetical protein
MVLQLMFVLSDPLTVPMTTIPLALKNPVRVTTTIRAALAASLQAQAEREGRSLSNLIAHILEQHIGTTESDRP